MSDERFDIEVTDKVSANVEKKLTGIARAAIDAYGKIEQLKASLSSINTTSMDKLTNASAKVTNALARETNAQARLQAASAKTAVADAQAAVAKQRLATETARTEAAQASSNREALRGATAAVQLEAAQQRAAAAEQRRKAALDAVNVSQAKSNVLQEKGGNNAKLANHHLLNLGFQLQDIFVSLASGQKPMTVFIQQGGQIGQIAAQSGASFGQMAKEISGIIGGLINKFGPLVIAAAAVGGAFALMTREINKSVTKSDLTKGLDLTEAQIKKLKNVSVTFGDTAKATFQVAGAALYTSFKGPIDATVKAFNTWLDEMVKNTAKEIDNIIGFFAGGYSAIIAVWNKLPDGFKTIGTLASNMLLDGLESAANGSIKYINKILEAIHLVQVGSGQKSVLAPMFQIEEINLSKYKKDAGVAGADLGAAAREGFDKGFDSVQGTAGKIGDAISKQAIKNARKRLQSQGEKLPKGPKDPKGPKGVDRAAAIAKINLELDNEYNRMGLLADEREKAARFDQIEESLTAKKITLNSAEAKSIKDKIEAIQNYTKIQAEMDRIYSETAGPQQTFNASLAASSKLLSDGKISLAQWTEQNAKATETYRQATEPLYSINKALDDQTATMGLFGDALDKANYLQSIQNTLQAQGKSLYDASTGSLTAEAQALMAKWQALQQGSYIQSQVNAALADTTANEKFIANYQSMMDRINQMRKDNLVSERAAAIAKNEIQQHYDELRLQNVTTTLDAIAQLSSSGNKKLAAIGKAAAIANATINAYEAVSKALTLPFPLNFAAAAAVSVAAGAQIAGIASTNVGGFNTGGSFTVGGKQGRDRNRVAMDVSRGERVSIETAAQQRAAERASTATVANDNSGGFSPKIVINNLGTGVTATVESVSRDEIRLMIKDTIAKDAPQVVARQMSDPNSQVSKAQTRNFNSTRKR